MVYQTPLLPLVTDFHFLNKNKVEPPVFGKLALFFVCVQPAGNR